MRAIRRAPKDPLPPARSSAQLAPALPRRSRRRPLKAAGVGALVIGVGAAAFVAGGRGRPQQTTQPTRHYATVERTDLVATRSFDATVASQPGTKVIGRSNGTITAMAAEGASVSRGEALYSVDGRPSVLMYGSVPMWRDIGAGAGGVDVQQLEANLQALGYSPGTVDETFTATTASAVAAWQTATELISDGVVHLGQIVFAPGPLRVDQQQTSVGTPVREGEAVMTTLSSNKIARVTLEQSDSSSLAAGDAVTIVLTSGKSVPGAVTSVDTGSSAAEQGGGSTATVTPKDAAALANVKDGAEITVNLVTDTHKGVLAVPVTALVARASGGYAVEVVRNGRATMVDVEPGLYADDRVEVAGEIHEGDRVVVP